MALPWDGAHVCRAASILEAALWEPQCGLVARAGWGNPIGQASPGAGGRGVVGGRCWAIAGSGTAGVCVYVTREMQATDHSSVAGLFKVSCHLDWPQTCVPESGPDCLPRLGLQVCTTVPGFQGLLPAVLLSTELWQHCASICSRGDWAAAEVFLYWVLFECGFVTCHRGEHPASRAQGTWVSHQPWLLMFSKPWNPDSFLSPLIPLVVCGTEWYSQSIALLAGSCVVQTVNDLERTLKRTRWPFTQQPRARDVGTGTLFIPRRVHFRLGALGAVSELIKICSGSWKGGSVGNRMHCSSRGPRFSSQLQCGSSHPSETLVPRDSGHAQPPWAPGRHMVHAHTYRTNTLTHEVKISKS
jgi:hypothetical protein